MAFHRGSSGEIFDPLPESVAVIEPVGIAPYRLPRMPPTDCLRLVVASSPRRPRDRPVSSHPGTPRSRMIGGASAWLRVTMFWGSVAYAPPVAFRGALHDDRASETKAIAKAIKARSTRTPAWLPSNGGLGDVAEAITGVCGWSCTAAGSPNARRRRCFRPGRHHALMTDLGADTVAVDRFHCRSGAVEIAIRDLTECGGLVRVRSETLRRQRGVVGLRGVGPQPDPLDRHHRPDHSRRHPHGAPNDPHWLRRRRRPAWGTAPDPKPVSTAAVAVSEPVYPRPHPQARPRTLSG
jgi:hypothetical protein